MSAFDIVMKNEKDSFNIGPLKRKRSMIIKKT